MRRVKADFVWSYGEEVLEPFGLNGTLARKPLTLLAGGRYVVIKLRDQTVVLPNPVSEERALDRESIAEELEPNLDGLDKVLKQREDERKETQEAGTKRRAALDYFRRRHVNLTRVLEAYLRLIGLDEVAKNLRLVVARRPNKAKKPDGADSGTSDGGTSDGGTSDSGTSDSGTSDSGTSDGGTADSGIADSGTSTSAATAAEWTEPASEPATETP